LKSDPLTEKYKKAAGIKAKVTGKSEEETGKARKKTEIGSVDWKP
jgi:hypothetical protein